MIRFVHLLTSAFFIATLSIHLSSAEISGVTVTPHVVADSMMYRRPRDPDLAAKVQLFVKGTGLPKSFNGKTPSELLESGDWAWHDLGTAVQLSANSRGLQALKRFAGSLPALTEILVGFSFFSRRSLMEPRLALRVIEIFSNIL